MKKLLLLLTLIIHCFSQPPGKNVGSFAFDLHHQLDKPQENLVFSPYGIFSNLALISYGAQGETARQIQKSIHLSNTEEHFLKVFKNQLEGLTIPQDGGYQLDIANALFPHKGTHFLTNFTEIAQETFQARLQSVDFEVVDSAFSTINDYISKKTRGKIPSLLQEGDIDELTRLVVTNAVYFEGDWAHPFLPNDTKNAPFFTEMGEELEVANLSQIHLFPYFENEEVQCLSLPFSRKDTFQNFLECVIILPKRNSLADIESTLTYKNLNSMVDALEPQLIKVEIPKFCFSRRLELSDPLKALGMELPFSSQADFSKINGMKDLFLSTVVHEAFFSFYEKGVTATAATASSIGLKSAPPSVSDATDFKANHPFLFIIMDHHSRSILFMGRCAKPEVSSCNEN